MRSPWRAGTLALLLAASLLAAPPGAQGRCLQEPAEVGTAEVDVIIVGAGMAGVTAARALADAGAGHRVIVLEGRERSGGRLLATPTVAGGAVDLGAMWVHEASTGNALYNRIVELGLPLSPRQDYSSMATFSLDGTRQPRTAFTRVAARWYSSLVPAMARVKTDDAAGKPDRSVADVYGAWLKQQSQFTPADVATANVMMHTNWQSLLNGNVTALSAARLGDAKSIPAVDVMLKDGFPAVVDVLKQGLAIKYNQAVDSIQHGPEGVSVITACRGVVYKARYALFTPSLGVLKAGSIAFDPPLPAAKQAVIDMMGFGVMDKVIFVFDKPFWGNDDFILRAMPDWSGRFAIFINGQKILGLPVLVAINVADTARALEELSDEAVVAEGMAAIRSMFPSAPNPSQTNVTRWAADAFALGSYSFYATGNPKNITGVLAERVGRLLFAGEATSDKPATVLGAYLSGQREAERLLRLLKSGGGGTA